MGGEGAFESKIEKEGRGEGTENTRRERRGLEVVHGVERERESEAEGVHTGAGGGMGGVRVCFRSVGGWERNTNIPIFEYAVYVY